MPAPLPKKILARQYEITTTYLKEVDKHLLDLLENRATEMFEIRDFAEVMHIHPTHLSNTIKLTTGKSPCFFFEEKILAVAKNMLQDNAMSIAEIATILTYDPSNFTKFFKHFTNQTPKQYREQFLLGQYQKTETVTIYLGLSPYLPVVGQRTLCHQNKRFYDDTKKNCPANWW